MAPNLWLGSIEILHFLNGTPLGANKHSSRQLPQEQYAQFWEFNRMLFGAWIRVWVSTCVGLEVCLEAGMPSCQNRLSPHIHTRPPSLTLPALHNSSRL